MGDFIAREYLPPTRTGSDNVKLEPADKKQCQAEKQVGAFSLGGTIGKRTRGTNKPSVIATEARAGRDGLVGSMSLCPACLEIAERQLGKEFFTIKEIKAKKPVRSQITVTNKCKKRPCR